MTEELKAILLPSRFYGWAQNTQPLIELEREVTLIEEGIEGRELLSTKFARRLAMTRHWHLISTKLLLESCHSNCKIKTRWCIDG